MVTVAVSSCINLSYANPFAEKLRYESWKAIADTLVQMPPEKAFPVYSEANSYINYYLRRMGGALARPVESLGNESTFWYVQSDYYWPSFSDSSNLAEVERLPFSSQFALVRYQRMQGQHQTSDAP